MSLLQRCPYDVTGLLISLAQESCFLFTSLCRDMQPRKCQWHNCAPAEPCKLPQLNVKYDGAGNFSLSSDFSTQQLTKIPMRKQPEPLELSPIWETLFRSLIIYLTLHIFAMSYCCVLSYFHRVFFHEGNSNQRILAFHRSLPSCCKRKPSNSGLWRPVKKYPKAIQIQFSFSLGKFVMNP